MVLRGQFLERPALVRVGQYVLEGLSHRGNKRPPLLVLPPRPSEGAGMDHPVCAEIAWAAAMAGFPTLRFNFRGVGASQGNRVGPQTDLDDADAALRLLRENSGVASAAAASIAGSAAILLELLKVHPGLAGLCLVQPPTSASTDLARVSVPLLVLVGAENRGAPLAALAASATEAGGRVEVLPDVDAAFSRNLTEVGKAVTHWLQEIGSTTSVGGEVD